MPNHLTAWTLYHTRLPDLGQCLIIPLNICRRFELWQFVTYGWHMNWGGGLCWREFWGKSFKGVDKKGWTVLTHQVIKHNVKLSVGSMCCYWRSKARPARLDRCSFMFCISRSPAVRHLTLVIYVTWHAHAVRTRHLTWLLVLSLSQSEHMTPSTLSKKQKPPVSAAISIILQIYMLGRSLQHFLRSALILLKFCHMKIPSIMWRLHSDSTLPSQRKEEISKQIKHESGFQNKKHSTHKSGPHTPVRALCHLDISSLSDQSNAPFAFPLKKLLGKYAYLFTCLSLHENNNILMPVP